VGVSGEQLRQLQARISGGAEQRDVHDAIRCTPAPPGTRVVTSFRAAICRSVRHAVSAVAARGRGLWLVERRYNDPADRPLLTTGGQRLAATPNAGGSSGFSEIFAFEQLARCELAGLVKTETEIVYDTTGKITDILVSIDAHKIGVSVVRAVAFPFGSPYTLDAATTIIQRKLEDIQASSMNVSAQDRWVKQVLAVLAYDDQHAETVVQAWEGLDAAIRADTIVVITATHGDDAFIYTNQ